MREILLSWIPVEERLPEVEPLKHKCIPNRVQVLGTYTTAGHEFSEQFDFVRKVVRGKEVCRFEWQGKPSPWNVIAWTYMPKPYRKEGK